jgi:DNA-binding NarL/FixJ family response regulator
MISVFLVDDHDILLDGIEAMLRESPTIKVVGKANSVEMAAQYIKVYKPDVVVTDISMPEKSGIELTTCLKESHPQIKIIALSMHDELSYISAMMKAGASGYLLKTVKNRELVEAICNVYAGETYIQQSLYKNFVNYLQTQNTPNNNKSQLLSAREIEIIRLIARDMTTNEISEQLHLSAYTVETHRKNIWRKTGVKSLLGLVNFAKENHLLS